MKSLAFDVDGEIVLALVSGSNRLDESRAGALRQVRPTARSGERTPTRFVPRRGSQSAVSRPSVTPRRCARSWTATSSGTTKCGPRPGTPRHVFAIEPNELVRAAGGTVSSSLGAPDRA